MMAHLRIIAQTRKAGFISVLADSLKIPRDDFLLQKCKLCLQFIMYDLINQVKIS